MKKSELLKFIPDDVYLRILYWRRFGKKLNLRDPKTYNEKLQWLKLYERQVDYVTMVDKCAVKDWIAQRIGEKYVVPLLGIWNRFDDINFDELPVQFVLKCTHDSGGLVICRDKASLDKTAARRKITKCLNTNYYWSGREWPYKNVPKKIICEKYLEDSSGGLKDYKVYCFDGKAKMMLIASGRYIENGKRYDYFDRDGNWLDMTWGCRRSEVEPQKPFCFEELFRIAEILAAGIPHVRVDFYSVENRVFFGEMTFYPASGFHAMNPERWDYIMGDWLKFPVQSSERYGREHR